jgi:hypothetical protein
MLGVADIGRTRRFQGNEIDSVISDIDYSGRRPQSVIALEGATRIPFGTMLSEARRFHILNALETLKADRR